MGMPLEKAKKILKAYRDNNYNASKALNEVGYSRETINTKSGRTIDVATNTLAKSGDKNAILEYLGMTRADIAEEYSKVIKQDKNYPAKLRALEPLLKKEGIQWDEQKTVTTVPVLNLTVSANKDTAQESHKKDVAQSFLCDAENMANNKDILEDKK